MPEAQGAEIHMSAVIAEHHAEAGHAAFGSLRLEQDGHAPAEAELEGAEQAHAFIRPGSRDRRCA